MLSNQVFKIYIMSNHSMKKFSLNILIKEIKKSNGQKRHHKRDDHAKNEMWIYLIDKKIGCK